MTIARKRASRRGASLVEFAFTLPIILLIFFGFIELARANMIRNSAKNAAYMGARRAVIPGGTAAEAEQKARDVLGATGVRNANVTVQPSVVTDQTPQITVSVSVSFAENSWVIPEFLMDSTLSQDCTLTRESSDSGF